jgi:hypothetical protein
LEQMKMNKILLLAAISIFAVVKEAQLGEV